MYVTHATRHVVVHHHPGSNSIAPVSSKHPTELRAASCLLQPPGEIPSNEEQRRAIEYQRHSDIFYDEAHKMFRRLRPPILQNSGSTARDHLASERTFLAWLRTGLGFVALGIAVERFSQFELIPPSPTPVDPGKSEDQKDKSENLALGLLAVGSGSIGYGTTRYFSNLSMLEKGLYKPSFYGAGGLSVAVVGLTGAAYWELVRGRRREKC